MCLVLVSWQQHPRYPLIIAGNRDEFHSRPTRDAHWWPDRPDVLGGRDLAASGTWLALNRTGRFATVTNYRDAELPVANLRSRGHLVTDFLESGKRPLEYLEQIDGSVYAGFNLLVSDGRTLAWLSNRGDGARVLDPGVYGLSNALLDSPWNKVTESKSALRQLIDTDRVNESELFRILRNPARAPVSEIQTDHLGFEEAHAISAPFIVLPDYGTRSSTVLMYEVDGSAQFHERRFGPDGRATGDGIFQVTPNIQE